jgi:tRNA pseudouridine55 synthase
MNGIIIIDKPSGWTSHDVVGKLRGLLHEKRIGHSGTLDPMATGVLPVFIGRATRAVEFCEADEKDYTAGLRLGVVTDTQDITGTVLQEQPCTISASELTSILPAFTGKIEQTPPMYSAIKIGGKKLYNLARQGVEVVRPPRQVTIRHLAFSGMSGGDYLLEVTCSKGTYIRTLCNDIGARLGCGGTMSQLRRTRAGAFTIEQAVTIETVEQAAAENRLGDIITPVDTVFAAFPAATANNRQVRRIRNGTPYPATDLIEGTYRVYDNSGLFLMLGRVVDGVMTTVKSFFEV